MTIDWTQAPPWARYAAMDQNGDWFWYAEKPRTYNGGWSAGTPNFESIGFFPVDWTQTLTERPTE